MSGTDFFDDDLVRQRESAKRIKMGPGDEPADLQVDPDGGSDVPSRPVSDFNLTRMARHRKEVDNQTATASQELERLRKRQEQLEGEKRVLEDLQRKHDEYGRGKREMIDHLRRSLVGLERKEVEAQRLSELLTATRQRFKELLGDVEGLQEETWPEDQVRDELNRSLGLIESARMEYNKSMARIDAIKADAPSATPNQPAVLFEEHGGSADEEKSFSYWMKVGLAVSLPVTVALIVIALLFFLALSSGLI